MRKVWRVYLFIATFISLILYMDVFCIQIKYIKIFSFVPIWMYILWYKKNILNLDITSKIRKYDKIGIPVIFTLTLCLTIIEIFKNIF